MSILEVVAASLLLTGVAFCVLGSIGLNRFPDVFARMHAATKPVTLGLASILVGAALVQEQPASAAKLLLAAGLQFLTAPTAAHMVGRAAYRAGTELSPQTAIDELADAGVQQPHDWGDPPDGA